MGEKRDAYVQLFRGRKARAIAHVLSTMGATAEDAAALPSEARRTAALIAGWKSVSDETWAQVCSVLASGSARLGASK